MPSWPLLPEMTGEPDVHRISSATTANRGASEIRSADDTSRSKPRFSREPGAQSGDMIRGSSVRTSGEERPNERMYSIDLGRRKRGAARQGKAGGK
jgi:hypothetical protein